MPLCSLLLLLWMAGFDEPRPVSTPAPKPDTVEKPKDDNAEAASEIAQAGKADTKSGEAKRNENVFFSLIDNNAQKESQVRLGITATIQEWQPDKNYYSTQYGNPPTGGAIQLTPKPAAPFHGEAWYLHNNSILHARSFFQVGPVAPARENRYGIRANIPLPKLWMLSIDGSQAKIRGQVNGNVLVPKLDERTPLTRDPYLIPTVLKFLNAFPRIAPNRTDINPRALNLNSPQTIDSDNAIIRLDAPASPRDRWTALYRFTMQDILPFQFVAGQNPLTFTQDQSWRLTWSRTWNPTTITRFTVGFDRTHSRLTPDPNNVGITVNFSNALEQLGPGTDIPIDRIVNRFRYAGEIRKVTSAHQFTAGFEVTRRQWNGSEVSTHRGILYFRNDFGNDGITNLRLGLSSRFSGSVGTTDRGFRGWNLGFYAGDTWRIRPDLTLTYGVRYEPEASIYEVNHLADVPFNCDCNNVSPRVALAWRRGRSVIRAGYGTHFAEVMPLTLQQVRYNQPNSIKVEIQKPDIVDPFGSLKPEDVSPTARSIFLAIEPNLVAPYEHHWTFTYERELPASWRLNVGYIGTRTHKLLTGWYTNRAIPAANPQDNLTQNINQRRPDPHYFDYRRVINAGRGYYDAARVSLITPNWHRLSADVSYWFSKAIDNGFNYTNTATGDDAKNVQAQQEYFMREDTKGLSSFDQPHAFLARVAYSTPKLRDRVMTPFSNWMLSSVILVKNGTPFTLFSGSDGPGFGNVDGVPSDRIDVIDPRVLGRTIGNPDTAPLLMPRSAFRYMQPGVYRGNIGVNTFRRGAIRNWNAAIGRTWTIRRESSFTFQAEAINLTNTPQFAEPGKELASPNFGQITNTLNDGRTFQFTARLRW